MVDMLRKTYAAFLFDMDGTLISSVAAAERVWTKWALEKGIDPASFLDTIHGVRAVDTIRQLGIPGLDVEAEAQRIERDEIEDLDGVVPILGAVEFLASLPPDRWAVVTSATLELAEARLGGAGIPLPEVFITAEDVSRGKPDPQGYRLAARRLGFDAAECLVFEDAAAGIEAGERAGADVLVVTATHHAPHGTAHAAIADYRGLSIRPDEPGCMALVFGAAAE
jgi:sugar-phosphatase